MENNRKDPRRQLIGAVSKALGQQFERDINAALSTTTAVWAWHPSKRRPNRST